MGKYMFLMIILATVSWFGCEEQSSIDTTNLENPCLLAVGDTQNITIYEKGNVTLQFGGAPSSRKYHADMEGCYKDVTMVVIRGELPQRVNIGDVYKIRVYKVRGKWSYDIGIIEVLLDN